MSEKDSRALLEGTLKELGVSASEMEAVLNPNPEQEAAAKGGSTPGPNVMEHRQQPSAGTPPDAAAAAAASSEELVPLTDEALEEALKFVRKKIGAKVRKKARKAKKYYRKMKAKLKKMAKRWKKSAAGKRFLKKYKKAKVRLGTMMQKYAGKKRLQISAGMELSAKLHEAVGPKTTDDKLSDIEILETGAVIAAMLGDQFEDLNLEGDAETARQTSDSIIAIVEKFEVQGTVPDDEMTKAVKAIGVCIDHYEKLEGEALPLPA